MEHDPAAVAAAYTAVEANLRLVLALDPDLPLSPDTDLASLGLDSLDALDLAQKLDADLGVDVEQKTWPRPLSLGGLVELYAERLKPCAK